MKCMEKKKLQVSSRYQTVVGEKTRFSHSQIIPTKEFFKSYVTKCNDFEK